MAETPNTAWFICRLKRQDVKMMDQIAQLQSYRATSPPVQPPGELKETTLSLILAHWLHYIKRWRHPQNRKKITYCTVVRGPNHGHKGNMYRKFREVWTCVFGTCQQTDIQSYKHTDTLIAILRIRGGTGEVQGSGPTQSRQMPGKCPDPISFGAGGESSPARCVPMAGCGWKARKHLWTFGDSAFRFWRQMKEIHAGSVARLQLVGIY